MEFVIVGAGSLGQSFAGLLAQAGQRVTLFATARSAERLRTSGAIRLVGAREATIPIGGDGLTLTTDAADLPHGAVVLFTTKGHDLPAAIEMVRSAAADRVAWTCGVQNGVLKDDLLQAAFGADRVVGAATIFGAMRQPDGTVQVSSPGITYLGSFAGRPVSPAIKDVAAVLDAAGVPTQVPDDIASVLWSKACNATGVFGVTVLARVSNDRLFTSPHLMRAYLTLVRETAATAQAYGIQVGDYPRFPPIRTFVDRDTQATLDQLSPPTTSASPPSYASMTQDLLAGAPLEVDAVFGDIVARAERKGVDVPGLRLVRDLIRGINPAHNQRTA